MHTRWMYGENGEIFGVVTTHPNGATHTRWVYEYNVCRVVTTYPNGVVHAR